MAKKNAFHLNTFIGEDVKKMLDELANEEGITRTAMLEMCVRHYYAQDTLDENIILARFSTLSKKVDWLNNKTETFYKLINFVLPYIIAHLPQLPKDKKEAQAILDSGTERMTSLIWSFRKIEKEKDISFVQQVWGDTQENLEETYERSVRG